MHRDKILKKPTTSSANAGKRRFEFFECVLILILAILRGLAISVVTMTKKWLRSRPFEVAFKLCHTKKRHILKPHVTPSPPFSSHTIIL